MNALTTLPRPLGSPIENRPPLARAGWSKPRLSRLHDALTRHVESGNVPGVVALLHRRGDEHVETIGSLTYGGDVPVRRDTIFRLASMTKPVTAVGAMLLLEECSIRLDDPVDPWLPELANRAVLRTIDSPLDDTVPATRPITVRDLLTFRSGYGEVVFQAPACPLQRAMQERRLPLTEWIFPGTPDDFMARLGTLPLAHQPGERWLYHMSAEILGVLIARVSGKSLGAFLRDRLFEPLGMKDTGFVVPEADLDRLPPCYGLDVQTMRLAVLDEARGGQVSRQPAFESGAGGLVSTVDDLLALSLMLLNKGDHNGRRILSRPAIELMTTDHLTPAQKAASPFFPGFWESRGWGLGLSVVTARTDLAEVPGRFGWDGAFGSSWYIDPAEEVIGILMTQRRPDVLGIAPVIRDFWTAAYQALAD